MVEAVRRGASVRDAAKRFGVSHPTVLYWLCHAEGKRLHRVDWSDRPRGPRKPVNRTPRDLERLVLTIRRQLKKHSVLGEFGAEAIHRALIERDIEDLPSVRTIGRILDRNGALDGRKRVRRPAPPPGWYLPDLADAEAELDSFDVIMDLVIKGGIHVDVLTGISLHGALPVAWPKAGITAINTVECLISHWRAFGLPAYAQFDNDTRFQGPHQHPDAIGRVIRLCLSLGVTPVFAPPRETGFQAAIENFNGRWQRAVWSRFQHRSRADVRRRSEAYLEARRARAAARIEAAPPRRPFPKRWRLNLEAPLRGHIIFLRRTDEGGGVHLLARHFHVDRLWVHRLVRAEVDLDNAGIRFFAMRRREPKWQPMLNEVKYKPHR